jgi:hypothetical protein
VLGAVALALTAACSRHTMQTTSTPTDVVGGFRTFALLTVPKPEDGVARSSCFDMMTEKSMAHRGVEHAVRFALEGRGYTVNERSPDFLVAVYGATIDTLDLTNWNFGYRPWTSWPDPGNPKAKPEVYMPGTVVVDVVSPALADRRLLWRGTGRAVMGEDPVQNAYALQTVATAIVKRFPKASGRVMATVPPPVIARVAMAPCR